MSDHEFQELLSEARLAVLDLKCEIAARRVVAACRRLSRLLGKANFNPGQLRIPAGKPGGGRWTDGSGLLVPAGARGRLWVTVRNGQVTLIATPGQTARLAVAQARADTAMQRMREIDPTWRPPASLTNPNSVEGAIRRAEANATAAEARIAELTRARFRDNQGPPLDPLPLRGGSPAPPPSQYIASYRALTGMPDTGYGSAYRRNDGTVAFAEVDGRPVFGVNSDAPGYTVTDETAALAMRSRLLDRYPEIMQQQNLGWKPNDAIFHAEANALLRAGEGGRYLSGRTIEMRVDRRLCDSCADVLPLLGLQIGNPTVTITDGTGALWIMRDGVWVRRGRP